MSEFLEVGCFIDSKRFLMLACFEVAGVAAILARIGFNDVPQTISSPYLIASGTYQTCAAHDGGLTCWGLSTYEKSEAPRTFDKIELLSVGSEQICVKDSKGLTCWGSIYVENLPTTMQNVTEVSAGGRNSCAIASGQLLCWGQTLFGVIF